MADDEVSVVKSGDIKTKCVCATDILNLVQLGVLLSSHPFVAPSPFSTPASLFISPTSFTESPINHLAQWISCGLTYETERRWLLHVCLLYFAQRQKNPQNNSFKELELNHIFLIMIATIRPRSTTFSDPALSLFFFFKSQTEFWHFSSFLYVELFL